MNYSEKLQEFKGKHFNLLENNGMIHLTLADEMDYSYILQEVHDDFIQLVNPGDELLVPVNNVVILVVKS